MSLEKIKGVLSQKLRAGWALARHVTPEPVKKIIRKIINLTERKIIAEHQAHLKVILEQESQTSSRPIIVFPPSLDWQVQLFQRPQQLALALARQGALVFYLQPHPDRHQPPFQMVAQGLYLCNVHVRVFEILEQPLIYLLTWNSDYARAFRNPRIIYDFVDEIDVFYGDRKKIAEGHRFLLKNARVVLATAKPLVDQVLSIRPDVIYCPNGVVYEHFDRSEEHLTPPEDISHLMTEGKPIIGYYGALARWFDYGLVKEVARLRPEYMLVLIGPDYDGTLRSAGLEECPNIHWLGVKPYEELPRYLACFDVATIPFVVNDITHAVSPLKLFEYMAGGKPIVITPMQESMGYPGVLVGDTPQRFAEQLDRALELKHQPEYIQLLKQIAHQNTWDARAKVILNALS